jgi:hypothetical protein
MTGAMMGLAAARDWLHGASLEEGSMRIIWTEHDA